MNSYPLEFLTHPQPLMFVAGLLQPTAPDVSGTTTPARPRALSSSVNPIESLSSSPSLPGVAPGTPTNEVEMPLGSIQLGSSPSHPEVEGLVTPPEEVKDEAFEALLKNLRDALSPLGGKGKVWLPESERRNFRILLVDKNVRLPIRKISPSNATSPGEGPATPHSPLSPLTTTSPLHPDGLIAPVWVRKHTELVPSVFVLFLRLYEPDLGERGEATDDEWEARQAAEKKKEQEMDDGLIKEIADRRRRLGERGIKLTVVLMASAAMLDSPGLDARLSHVRRASSLSSKASLFVLTPVPADQLPDFVQSLQDALYESAMEYYAQHNKRVRRKRSRVPASQIGVPAATIARTLSPAGWAVRYDWKAGWFAEVRGEYDVARRHYEDCWNELARMFSSTTTLPPRTKRWAEAKVLADCVAVRICRLLLYEAGGARVLGPFYIHLRRFGDLSRGWGIGEETFEYWSWTARQYRILAELLDTAIGAGLQLPTPPLPTFPQLVSGVVQPPEFYSTPMSSVQPTHVLQSPAYYFYSAACCSIERKLRYEEAVGVERDATSEAAAGYVSSAPGFANEKKVDHAALVIELFTKAYTLLKDQEGAHDRVALYVAFRIAETYCRSGQHEMAMRFFERISPSFRKDQWNPIVREIRTLWYECAQMTGNVEAAARLLLEMMPPASGVEGEDRNGLQEDLLSLLKTTAPSSTNAVAVDVPGLLDVRAGFRQSEASISDTVPFQLAVSTPTSVNISDLNFSELRIAFDDRPDVIIKSSEIENNLIDVGTVGSEASASTAKLVWKEEGKLVIQGTVLGLAEGECKISSILLVLKEAAWTLHVRLPVEPLQLWTTSKRSFAPLKPLSTAVTFIPRPHDISVKFSPALEAYVGVSVPLTIIVTNNDDRALEARLSVFLQPGEDDDDSTIEFASDKSQTLLKDIHLGALLPKAQSETVVILRCGRAAVKTIDVSLQSEVAEATPSSPGAFPRSEEASDTISIPVQLPFASSTSIRYPPNSKGWSGEAVMTTVLSVPGTNPLIIEKMDIQVEDESVELLSSSSSIAKFPQTWDSTTSYSLSTLFNIRGTRRPSAIPPSSAAIIITWRPGDLPESEASIQSRVELPPLTPPPRESFVSAIIASPPTVNLHQPFPVMLRFSNSHPSEPAYISAHAETADAFVWTGSRAIRVAPSVPAGGVVELDMEVTAVGGTGWYTLPLVKVWEGEGGERREVRVIDQSERAGAVLVRP